MHIYGVAINQFWRTDHFLELNKAGTMEYSK